MRSSIDAREKIKELMKELNFQYKTNYSFYVGSCSDIVKHRLNYYDENWNNLTNFFINIQTIFKRLSERNLHKCLAACIVNSSDNEKREGLVFSSVYGYLEFQFSKQVNACIISHQIKPLDVYAELFFHDAARYLSQLYIVGWGDEAARFGDDILEAINAIKENPYGVTSNGERVNPISWFIIDLYTLAFGKWYIEKNAKHPSKKSYKLYQRVLDNWDTQNPEEIEKLNFILCEMHLIELDNKAIYDRQMDDILGGSMENAIELITHMSEHGSHDDFAPRELDEMYAWLFPYEILVWLKLREQKGLSNPKTFSHPLMNTPITKFFLELETPLPKPSTLPFAKELLGKLKEQCPNVEIPEWIEKMPSSHEILPEDFMS